jgi:CBS domain-containing protein
VFVGAVAAGRSASSEGVGAFRSERRPTMRWAGASGEGMSGRLRSSMEAADRLTVGTIAQPPYCVSPDKNVREVYDHAKREGFDVLPIKDPEGRIRTVVETSHLETMTDWDQLRARARPVNIDDLVAAAAPMFSVLDRIVDGPLLCLGGDGVEGIVTMYDMNQPAAHYFGFALAIVVEAGVGRAIDEHLEAGGHGPDEVVDLAIRSGVRPNTIKR